MPTLYESYNTGDDESNAIGSGTFGTDTWMAQTFTPSSSHFITSVKLKLFRVGSPGTLTVSIRATDGDGKPTGNDLTSGTTNADTLTTNTSGEWREISLTSYSLTVGVMYAICCRVSVADWNNMGAWRDDSTGSYTGGRYRSSNDAGATWGDGGAGLDFMFEEWGNPLVTFIPIVTIM